MLHLEMQMIFNNCIENNYCPIHSMPEIAMKIITGMWFTLHETCVVATLYDLRSDHCSDKLAIVLQYCFISMHRSVQLFKVLRRLYSLLTAATFQLIKHLSCFYCISIFWIVFVYYCLPCRWVYVKLFA